MTWTGLVKHRSLVLTLAALIVFLPLGSLAQERIPENTIAVQGTGAVTAQPDSFQIMIGVVTEATTVETARTQNAQRMEAVLQRLRALNIPNLQLQTMGFSVHPIYDQRREPVPTEMGRPTAPRIVGYRVQNNINVRVEGATPERIATDASRIIDTALVNGANTVNGINFFLSRQHPAQQEALQLAVQQARQHGQTIAQAAGVRITGVHSIEAVAHSIPLRSAPMMAAREAMAAPTPVEPGELEVTANATVRFDFQE